MHLRFFVRALAALLLIGAAAAALAQTREEFDALERRVRALEQQLQSQPRGQPLPSQAGNPWRQLRKGMAEDEVVRLLGQPRSISRGSVLDTFFFQGGGYVMFSQSRVSSWSEP
jgi:hypothetical protein